MSRLDSLVRGSGVFADASRWSFARPVRTVDPTGEPVEVDQPRFGRSVGLASLPGEAQMINAQLAPGSFVIHAGVDVDGQTPVLMVHDAFRRQLLVYRDEGGHLELLTIFTCSTDPQGLGSGDVLRRATDGCPVGTVAYEPASGLVVHGTLVLLCRARRKIAPGEWQLQGVGVCYSTDLGATWTPYADDLDDPRDVGRVRLSGWELTNYYCPYHVPGKALLEVFVPLVDYRLAGPQPVRGGRAFWFKMTRANEQARFIPLWSGKAGLSAPRMARYTLDTNPASNFYCHFHACGITEYEPKPGARGLQVILGIGDGAASQTARILIPDAERYWEDRDAQGAPLWTVQLNWHGTADSAIIDPNANDGFGGPGSGPTRRNDGNSGNQFVGCGPGPDPGSLLLGADAVGEGIWILRPGNTPGGSRLHETAVSDHGFVCRSNCFFMRVDHPERATRTVVCDVIKSMYGSGLSQARNPDGLWISHDSGRAGTWSWMSLDGATQRFAHVGGWVYLMSPDGTSLFRRRLPRVVVGRPLQVGPGGDQWLRDDASRFSVSGLRLLPCPRDAQGRWLVPRADGLGTLGPIEPQPPTLVGTVWRVVKRLEEGVGRIGSVMPSATHPSGASPFRLSDLYRVGGNKAMRCRWWLLNHSGRATDSPFLASRSPCSSQVRFFFESPGEALQLGTCGTISNDRWEAVTRTLVGNVTAGELFGFAVNASDLPGDVDCFVAWSEFLGGFGCVGYPLPPDLPACAGNGTGDEGFSCALAPTSFPHERATLRNLSLSGSWTLLAAGLTPMDSWEQFSGHDPSDSGYPLLSVTDAAGDRHVTIVASPRTDATRTKVASLEVRWNPEAGRGSWFSRQLGPASFLRDRPLLVALVCSPSGLSVHATLGGTDLQTLSVTAPEMSEIPLSQVRFGRHDFGEVGAFQWFAIRTRNEALSALDVRQAFQTLSFLDS